MESGDKVAPAIQNKDYHYFFEKDRIKRIPMFHQMLLKALQERQVQQRSCSITCFCFGGRLQEMIQVCQSIQDFIQTPETQTDQRYQGLIAELDQFKDFKQVLKVEFRMTSFHYQLIDDDPTFQDELRNIVFYLQEGTFDDYHSDFHEELKAFAPILIETLVAIVNQLNSFDPIAKAWISFIQKSESLDSSSFSSQLIWHFVGNRYHLSNQSKLLEQVWKLSKEKMDKTFRKALTEFLNKKVSIKNADGYESDNYGDDDEEMEDAN